jgi:multidrug efflux pump subunit AcrB
VIVQAAGRHRRDSDDLKQLKVRSERGHMVPLTALAQIRGATGPGMIVRYNLYPAVAINGSPAPGISSGEAIAAMEQLAHRELTWAMRTEWTELALLQLRTGGTAMAAFALAVAFAFLVLAAQYESWSLPLAVILVVPLCLLCSLAGVLLARLDLNIFTQVGFVVLIGLACKNAILIVEFAKKRREGGADTFTATLEACQIRLRPIVMTSLAFVLGVVPLVLATGAGSEMRRTLGTAVFAGMLGVTIFGVLLTPVFYYVIQRIVDRRATASEAQSQRTQRTRSLMQSDHEGHEEHEGMKCDGLN